MTYLFQHSSLWHRLASFNDEGSALQKVHFDAYRAGRAAASLGTGDQYP